MRPIKRRQRGAALLILLTVVALGAASLFIGAARPDAARRQRELRNVAAVGQAREALIGFALAHGRLPRPAALDGAEQTAICDSDAACTGFLPWRSLGIAPGDAWGKLLRYSVTPVFTVSPVIRATSFGDKTIVTRDSHGDVVYVAGFPLCSPGTPCIVAVILSAGRDNFGTDVDGRAQATGSRTNIDEAANQIAVNDFMRRPVTADARAAGGEFDDLVAFIAPSQLVDAMTRAKVLP
jgi:type II secretory pathway pseudopilin PulG